MNNTKVWKDHLAISMPGSPKSPKAGIVDFLNTKVQFFKRVIQDTVLAIKHTRSLELMGQNEYHSSTALLQNLFDTVVKMNISNTSSHIGNATANAMLNNCQKVNDELASIFRTYGTMYIDDLISVCLQSDYLNKNCAVVSRCKLELIRKHFRPLSYKSIQWKPRSSDKDKDVKPKVIQKTRIVEDSMIMEHAATMECFDLARISRTFHTKVHGVRIALQDAANRKTIIVNGIMEDISPTYLDNVYIHNCLTSIKETAPNINDFNDPAFSRFIGILGVKELLVYSSNELHDRYVGYMNQIKLIKQKSIAQVVREFLASDLYSQRTTLIQLLIKSEDPEYQYLAYLLYDLLSTESNGYVDSRDQVAMFDSFPLCVRKYFKDAMKQTIKYTESLSSFDSTKIPLEQQICLLKASDAVKEKAMLKLKEVKSKSEDSGSKARQFLEGLLRIPFGTYRSEPILSTMEHAKEVFGDLRSEMLKQPSNQSFFTMGKEFTSIEMKKAINVIREKAISGIDKNIFDSGVANLTNGKREDMVRTILAINGIIKDRALKCSKLTHSGRNIVHMKQQITNFANLVKGNQLVWNQLMEVKKGDSLTPDANTVSIPKMVKQITNDIEEVGRFLDDTKTTLDKSVHGHEKAKRQIERIIGQWINGENSGYCFGFEGPPGVGKTSLAKRGIAQCLKDQNGNARPFSFIPIGGSSNGSTLEGHNYTYVGSTWGRIVDIVMESKCMNPIIFIDELDKVSNTEHGKEIIGILTHLVDPTQNDTFNDKYFSGVDLDLSKALFIFSYNDPALIDRILLDRIHRVKFQHLMMSDKLTIVRDYMWPEILGKMGLDGVLVIKDDTVSKIIDEYTCEPGVRKLRELLFEIAGEVNLQFLRDELQGELPIEIDFDSVKNQYLKERQPVRRKTIPEAPRVGLVNGMWANALGQGGILPIEVSLFPSNSMLELKLTGMQGDVMKESMNVALTVAWRMVPDSVKQNWNSKKDKNQKVGIHVHCPEGATPKDGPSAGAAITLAMFSLFTKRRVRNNIAMTGEINLRGEVTAIGGLDLKILGGIRAGADMFLYPTENQREYDEMIDKYGNAANFDQVSIQKVSRIEEVMDAALVDK